MEYEFKDEPGGKVLMTGTITQLNAPSNWFMVLPVALTFGKTVVHPTVTANGPSTKFGLRLPARPGKVELDPERWILSEKTSTK